MEIVCMGMVSFNLYSRHEIVLQTFKIFVLLVMLCSHIEQPGCQTVCAIPPKCFPQNTILNLRALVKFAGKLLLLVSVSWVPPQLSLVPPADLISLQSPIMM